MTEQERANLDAELSKAEEKNLLMAWHEKLYDIASMLAVDELYPREEAAKDILAVLKEMRDEMVV